MNATTLFRESVLCALDGLMKETGFRRNKRSHAWKQKVSPFQSHGIHLNFGMNEAAGTVSIIPSVWLRDERIAKLEVESGIVHPEFARERAQFGNVMKSVGGHDFTCTVADDSNEISKDIFDEFFAIGIPYLKKLKDANYVLKRLQADKVADWPVPSRSDRARILPLLLICEGRISEACITVIDLEIDISGRDQIIPDYRKFVSWLRSNYCNNVSVTAETS